MKFIHTADLHLDSPFEGLKNNQLTPNSLWQLIYKAPFDSFTRIVNDAIQMEVDFLLIAGDLFDSENQTPKVIDFLINKMNELKKHDIYVFINFGNHDYQTGDIKDYGFPDNVIYFDDEISTKEITLKTNEKVYVTSFSYTNRWINDDLVKDFPINESRDGFHIGMVHGSIEESGKGNYAPFSIYEMKEKNYDYWALGHIHKRETLSTKPLINYPGNIQGRHKNESGEKGYLLINNDKDSLNSKFFNTAPILWNKASLNVNDKYEINDFIEFVLKEMRSNDFKQMNLIDLKVVGMNEYLSELSESWIDGTLLAMLQSKLQDNYEQLNFWIYSLNFVMEDKLEINDLDDEFWQETKDEIFTFDNVKNLTNKLIYNQFIYDYLNNPETIEEIKNEGEGLVSNYTKKGKDSDEN
ncbi:DNA repair exonuclease [Lactobacillus sp. S2-2]|uniref:metallophosphoesterase family protein n=1 Tax=Lactobacillus sp. S2-2 TaxID=2692917 RepID=UPI001F1711CE|nr:DNA repair exonuclease [Lactobacillus sp. S2-2]MCF6515168.1 DNA repair exonuclease [Lactobacillus sp. S2-2]